MRPRHSRKGRKKTNKTNGGGLLPISSEDDGIKLRAGEKRQHDGAKPGEKLDPGLVGPKNVRTNEARGSAHRRRAAPERLNGRAQ